MVHFNGVMHAIKLKLKRESGLWVRVRWASEKDVSLQSGINCHD